MLPSWLICSYGCVSPLRCAHNSLTPFQHRMICLSFLFHPQPLYFSGAQKGHSLRFLEALHSLNIEARTYTTFTTSSGSSSLVPNLRNPTHHGLPWSLLLGRCPPNAASPSRVAVSAGGDIVFLSCASCVPRYFLDAPIEPAILRRVRCAQLSQKDRGDLDARPRSLQSHEQQTSSC